MAPAKARRQALRLTALTPPSIATRPRATVSAVPIAIGHVNEWALIAFPNWNWQMNNPVMMLSTPAAVGFQVLKGMQPIVSDRRPAVVRRKDRIRVIRGSDIHHPPVDCCGGLRRQVAETSPDS